MKEQVLEVLNNFNEELTEDLERDLFQTGILDSFDLVKLVVELEDSLEIEIDIEDVTADNFQTANSIIRLIERMKG